MKNSKLSTIGGWIAIQRIGKRLKPSIWIKRIFGTNGLILTLLLGILINTTSTLIQEKINKQKYFELLQWEITSHMLYAGRVFTTFNQDGIIYNPQPYQDIVYKSGLNNGYLFDLSPDMISKITSYYDVIVNGINNLDDIAVSSMTDFRKEWMSCIFTLKTEPRNGEKCDHLKIKAEEADKIYSEQLFKSASQVYENNTPLLKEFRPAAERMNSPLLRFFMGSRSIEIMK